MQVNACIAKTYPNLTKRTRSYGDETRERILRAAEKLFSRDGFQCATTREIAREAQVNETTLFRQFRTREELLRETILSVSISPEELTGPQASWRNDLPGQLEQYVRKYYALLLKREALVRALVGEGRILPPAVRRVCLEKMAPMRATLADRLRVAQKAGWVRQDVDLNCAVDILRDAVHAGMLRHTTYGTSSYSVDTYLKTIVAVFIEGVRKLSAKSPSNDSENQHRKERK
jgi:AcrR family transcriptional regulator